MNTGITKLNVAITTIACMSLLSGCLMEEEISQAPADAVISPTGNSRPTITGNPQTAVLMGADYSFTPSANDADGDTLTFSVENLPSWASFDSSSGEVSGQPTLADVGVFQNLVISVSDGEDQASLPSFGITVSQVELASVTIAWDAPTENTDGSALTDLAGYRIYYGTADDNLESKIDINSVGMSTYVIENLLPDTYFVAVTAINSAGAQSVYSNIVTKVAE